MADVEESLLQLQRLIARARREGVSGTNGKENDGEPPKGYRISVQELERQFAGLEEKLFREQGLREQARELHQRARRRRQQQQQQCRGGQKQWKERIVPVEEYQSASYDTMDVGFAETAAAASAGTMSCELYSHPSSSLNGSLLVRQEGPARDVRCHLDGSHVEEAETPRGVRGTSCVKEPDAHLLVDITDGSTRFEGVGVGHCVENNNELLYNSSSCAPSYSFAQAYADDDRQRLLFIVDQLSHILREERRQKETLLSHVVAPMTRHIEALERDLVHQQREITALKREVELRASPRHMLRSKCVKNGEKIVSCDSGEKGDEEDGVLILLQYCEEQLLRLTGQKQKKM